MMFQFAQSIKFNKRIKIIISLIDILNKNVLVNISLKGLENKGGEEQEQILVSDVRELE